MKSKIRVEFDYSKNEPYLQIGLDADKQDPDLKDGMIKHFFEHAWNNGIKIEWPDQNPGFSTPQLRIDYPKPEPLVADRIAIKPKHVRYWLEMLPQEHRLKAFENLYNQADLSKEANNTTEALMIAFGAGSGYFSSIQTKEGVEYWEKVAKEADKELSFIKALDDICTERLSGELYNHWLKIKDALVYNRESL